MSKSKQTSDSWQGHPNDREDLIDFPCSDVFASHYFREGYSTYQPPQRKPPQASTDQNLKRKVNALATEVAGLHCTVQALIRKVRELKKTSASKVQPLTRKISSSTVRAGITLEELERV